MNINRINQAREEAKRFLRAADAVRDRLQSDNLVLISGSKEGGACRRASMDLTRALANLRKP